MIDFWPKAIFSQRFLAFRLPQKIPFPKTVICYLLFVTQKIRFWKLSTVNCNACNAKKNPFMETVILLYCNAWD